ncbi:helix-turn-helix domain-containing protein [Streptomyces griseoincarnatus]
MAGRTREDVAAVFQVSLKAVDSWWASWLAGGRDALVASRAGAGSASIRCAMRSSSGRSGRPYWITVPMTCSWLGSCGRVPE